MLLIQEENKMKKIATKARKSVIEMIYNASSGHLGGSLSCLDILTYLYLNEINLTKENMNSYERNRVVLSKGHAVPAIYALFVELDILNKEELQTFRKINSRLQGHPNMNELAGIDMSTGSLGQGISAAVGMALANKYKNTDYYTYAICGDGELQEGQVYEAIMAAAHYHLNQLIIFVDYNGLQIDGAVEQVMNINPIDLKFKAFNWNVIGINGHDFNEINAAITKAKKSNKPTVILAYTIKGKGVSFMENNPSWHGKAPNTKEMEKALKELNSSYKRSVNHG